MRIYRYTWLYFYCGLGNEKNQKIIDNSSKMLYHYTTVSETDKFLKQKQDF